MNAIDVIRTAAESNLEFFIRLLQPNSVLGSIHSELISWLTREDGKSHQLVLLPRGHRKSYIMALSAAWEITRNPATTILYISSTSNLANKQLGLIKDILTSDTYRKYWPEMVNRDESKRLKWTESEISVDHPKRKEESVRDPTIFTAGITTNIVGLHCDWAYLDDFVTDENSSSPDGRDKVLQKYSLLTSIKNPGGRERVAGTRYDPDDLYGTMLSKMLYKYDDKGSLLSEEPLFEEFTAVLENAGDGSGEYTWPRQQREDGRWFGFDRSIYESIRSQYSGNLRLFRSQYYNNPLAEEAGGLSKEYFQYYDKAFVTRYKGDWYMKGSKLNVFAAMDFAFTVKETSDYSAIVVVGVDRDLNYYVLDIDRFKTDSINEYFNHILRLHQKWNFYKIKAEATAAQSVIINTLKTDYIRKYGLALTIDEHKPHIDKQSRIMAILEPKYANRQVWHYLGGLCQVLEEELVRANPSHDDVKDALASAIEVSIAPMNYTYKVDYTNMTHPKFGGIL